MTRDITPVGWPATGAVDEAFAEVRASFDQFCLAAGIEGARHDDGGGCHGGLRAAPRSRRASGSPWPRPAQPQKNGLAPLDASAAPPRLAPRPSEKRRRDALSRVSGPRRTNNITPLAAHLAPPSRMPNLCRPTKYRRTSQKHSVV